MGSSLIVLSAPTSFLRHVGKTPPPRHRFCAMSGEHLCPDIVFMPCRENTSTPTSFLHHVGRTPLPRHRFRAMLGEYKYYITKKETGARPLSKSIRYFIIPYL